MVNRDNRSVSFLGETSVPDTTPDFQALIEETPAMLWRGDRNGRCVFLNRAQRDFWGIDNPILDEFEWATTLVAEDQEKVFEPFNEGMTKQQSFTCEARYRRADGVIRLLRTKASPYFSQDNTFCGMIGVNEDVTDLREVQANLDKRNQELASSLLLASGATSRFELATQISGLAMSEHDEQLRYTWAHNLPGKCLGHTPAEFIGGEFGSRVSAILQDVLASGEPAATEIDFLIDGHRHWLEIQACRITTDAKETRVIASALDVTARKLNETKLELLAKELAHRVKNIYSVTEAIIRQSARSSNVDPDFLDSVSGRLAALARAQDALMASPNDRVSVKSIVDANLGHLSRIDVTGDAATIPGRSAPYLALALHELGTNSTKYGALSQDAGRVSLEWRDDDTGNLQIEWTERSITALKSTNKEGFGTALLTRIFAAATNGKVSREFTASGLHWSAIVPTAPELRVFD